MRRIIVLFIMCLLYLFIGVIGIATGEGTSFKDSPVPVWACWGVVVTGLFGCCICIYDYKKKKMRKRPDTVIDTEYAQAKAAMDDWYFRNHGEMPDVPQKEETK